MDQKFSKIIKFYVPALIGMGVIFYFSSIPSLRYTKDIALEIILRKGAHFVEYIILTVLFWRIILSFRHFSLKKTYVLTFILVALFAASDEFHQMFTPGRTGLLFDVVFDWISIFIGLELILLFKAKRGRVKIIILVFLAIAALVGMGYKMIRDKEKKWKTKSANEKIVIMEEEELEKKEEVKTDPKGENKAIQSEEQESEKIAEKILIKVPFTSQAPFANWDDLHEEACEEASLIMIKYYLDGKELSKDVAEKEIQSLVAFEKKTYGEWKDSNAREITGIAEDYYGIKNLKAVYDFKLDDLKKYLAREKPIIVPAAGRLLGNPNFTAPGPLYHNLVLVGYDRDTIITNDPGTRKGEGYQYGIETLYNAIHDFPGKKEEIEKGRKAMIIIE